MIKQLKINKMKNFNYKILRKIAFTLLMLLTLCLNAQNDNVIKFMGIPVDGPKSEMISKLEEKGFSPTAEALEVEWLERQLKEGKRDRESIRENDDIYPMQGHFDGHRCTLYLYSFRNNVWQIIVLYDKMSNEYDAKALFNTYVDRLDNKYESIIDKDNYKIDLTKDISEDYSNKYNAYYTVGNVEEKFGVIVLAMSHPRNNEYYIALYYCNSANIPNGDDL